MDIVPQRNSFLGRIVEWKSSGTGILPYPKAAVTSKSIYMRLTLMAGGKPMTHAACLGCSNHPTDKNWLRALPIALDDLPGYIARDHAAQRAASERAGGGDIPTREPRGGCGFACAPTNLWIASLISQAVPLTHSWPGRDRSLLWVRSGRRYPIRSTSACSLGRVCPLYDARRRNLQNVVLGVASRTSRARFTRSNGLK